MKMWFEGEPGEAGLVGLAGLPGIDGKDVRTLTYTVWQHLKPFVGIIKITFSWRMIWIKNIISKIR